MTAFVINEFFQSAKNIDLSNESLDVESNRYRIEHQDQSNPHVGCGYRGERKSPRTLDGGPLCPTFRRFLCNISRDIIAAL